MYNPSMSTAFARLLCPEFTMVHAGHRQIEAKIAELSLTAVPRRQHFEDSM